MEIKAELKKPYTDEQKCDFIVENNYELGYDIKETKKSLQAWGYTKDEIKQQELEKKKQEILQKLNEIDLKSIRAIRSNDTEYLAKYEKEAEDLRKELSLIK